jgi:hypothetical protein
VDGVTFHDGGYADEGKRPEAVNGSHVLPALLCELAKVGYPLNLKRPGRAFADYPCLRQAAHAQGVVVQDSLACLIVADSVNGRAHGLHANSESRRRLGLCLTSRYHCGDLEHAFVGFFHLPVFLC